MCSILHTLCSIDARDPESVQYKVLNVEVCTIEI